MFKKALSDSKEMLKGKRIKSIGAMLVYIITVMLFVGIYAPAGLVFVALPTAFGLYYYFLNMKEGKEQLEDIIEFYKDWKTGLKLMLAMVWYIIIVFLGLILFIVPGIIWSYRYFCVFYLIIDNRDMKIEDAFKKSKEMMHGHKFKVFLLEMVLMLLPFIMYYAGVCTIIASVPMNMINEVIEEEVELDRNDFDLGEDFEEYDDINVVPEIGSLTTPTINYAMLAVGYVLFFIGLIWLLLVCPRVLAAEVAYYIALKDKENYKEVENNMI